MFSFLKFVVDCTANFLKLRKDILPVHLVFIPASSQIFPTEIVKKRFDEIQYLVSIVGIENLSKSELKEIKIILAEKPNFSPKSNSKKVNWNFDNSLNEISIESLNPNSEIYFWLYYENNKEVTKPIFMVNGSIPSKLETSIGLARKYPQIGFSYLVTLFAWSILLIVFPLVGFLTYKNLTLNPNEYRTDLPKHIKFKACRPVTYEGESINIDNLEKHEGGLNDLLKWNNVSDEKELYKLERVVVCEKIEQTGR